MMLDICLDVAAPAGTAILPGLSDAGWNGTRETMLSSDESSSPADGNPGENIPIEEKPAVAPPAVDPPAVDTPPADRPAEDAPAEGGQEKPNDAGTEALPDDGNAVEAPAEEEDNDGFEEFDEDDFDDDFDDDFEEEIEAEEFEDSDPFETID